ncbi:cardiolipin-specific deacylase 1, mitochondrial [[Candida] railenensis]|uniref:Cardiolipin-specific deacylase 1, mitochondrial n=1 Tax=[Candida] railenensis TaxID=45579 RepID=A0A9P0VWW3_9ASCO|nr:cardiolipin-specific deacylase 1, mitochondrial [[Candida] railenensis]
MATTSTLTSELQGPADSSGINAAPPKTEMSNRRNSISLKQSILDWWSSPSELSRASFSSNSSSASSSTAATSVKSTFASSRLKNLKIEYNLYKAIFSDEIYVVPPGDAIIDDDELQDYPYYAQILDIELDDGNFLHEFYLQNNLDRPADGNDDQVLDLVVVHGYMAASGYFLKNYEQLLRSTPGIRIHALDLLGFGNSSRPKFPQELLTTPEDHEAQIKQTLEVENWFIDRIEEWRVKRGIKKFKLIAHSMGAYLMSCYLMKYNNGKEKSVHEFLAVSPMGTEPNYQSLINDSKYQFNHHAIGGDPFKELTARQKNITGGSQEDSTSNGKLSQIWKDLGAPKFPKVYVLRKLWEWNKSPFQALQLFGPFYSKLLSYWSFQRFANLVGNEDEATKDTDNTDLILKLHYYSFSIFNQFQGSGELAITKLINHEILAKLPLADRGLVEYLASNNVKTMWMYGDRDWMNSNGGKYVHDKISKLKSGISEFQVIKGAGHHIYLDNPEEFNKSSIQFLGLGK